MSFVVSVNTETKSPGLAEDVHAFPRSAPSDPSAPHVTAATETVDASCDRGPLQRIWESIGYDEINWTYTPTGKRLLKTSRSSRAAATTCGRTTSSAPAAASASRTGDRQRLPRGRRRQPVLRLHHRRPGLRRDRQRRAPCAGRAGVHPARSGAAGGRTPSFENSPTTYTAYEAGAWAYPPRDYDKWGGLIEALARHCVERYGEEEVVQLALGAVERTGHLLLARHPGAVQRALHGDGQGDPPCAAQRQVGGPAVTSGGLEFMKGFLEYTSSRNEPLDFVSFHTKGCRFPTREYRPIGARAKERLNPSSTKMLFDIRSFNRAIAEFEEYRDLPAIVDECDAAVPAHFGRYDNANYRVPEHRVLPGLPGQADEEDPGSERDRDRLGGRRPRLGASTSRASATSRALARS